MPSQASPDPAPKPTLPPFWKWLMRITFALTMILFLAPAVYVVKYYAVDRPREQAIAEQTSTGALEGPQRNPDRLLRIINQAADLHRPAADRQWAVTEISATLLAPGISYKRPIECLMAKATLAELTTKDPNPVVRAQAAAELEKVAKSGAVIRR